MAFFSVILKKNTKTPEVILNTRLDAQEVFLAYTKEVSVRHSIFLSVIEKIVTCIFCPYFFCFRLRARGFYSQLKRTVEPSKNFHNAWSITRKSCPLSSQPIRARALLYPYNNNEWQNLGLGECYSKYFYHLTFENDNWPHDCYNWQQLEHLRQQRKRRLLPWQIETTWPCSFFNLLQKKNMRSDEWYMVGLHLVQLPESFFLTRLVKKKIKICLP